MALISNVQPVGLWLNLNQPAEATPVQLMLQGWLFEFKRNISLLSVSLEAKLRYHLKHVDLLSKGLRKSIWIQKTQFFFQKQLIYILYVKQ